MVIDAHCHSGASWYGFNHNKLTAYDIAKNYEKFGIDKGCLSSWEVAYDFEHGNQEVLKIYKELPEVFIPFVILAPRDGQEAVDMLRRYVEDYHFKGVKIHPSCNRFRVDSKWLMDPICEKCAEYKIPMLIHSENNGYCNALMIGELAGRHPGVNFIVAHLGDEGGMGYLDCIEAAKDHANIYLDTTGCANEVFHIPTCIEQLGSERIVFGTDSPICSMKVEMDKIVYADAFGFPVTEKDKANILGLNIQRLLGL